MDWDQAAHVQVLPLSRLLWLFAPNLNCSTKPIYVYYLFPPPPGFENLYYFSWFHQLLGSTEVGNVSIHLISGPTLFLSKAIDSGDSRSRFSTEFAFFIAGILRARSAIGIYYPWYIIHGAIHGAYYLQEYSRNWWGWRGVKKRTSEEPSTRWHNIDHIIDHICMS